ncbi:MULTISPECIES: TetR/AcrR family transcriptional regulator [unclassified Rhodococcus (in: high G+C Gram-positive bacteria)]|uniref:TetR/AcrR family transcriptional regulator n=1 Tax=unclassified Rhodococcus (in: high G+C Gram-positive bacteria) TaxID=192944 RepID=UPI000AA78591|nr:MULTISPECIES: TetR/AcrR family transcriptional regulator [unclassified Rhodococcus (in: high G+C Gram-positive bacteria)]
METDHRARILSAADTLFYAKGVQAVGMDELRTEAGVPLKRLYAEFPSKSAIVTAVLDGRTTMWNSRIDEAESAHESPRDKLLSIFDFLHDWFLEDDFRGCAFINSFGELGATMPAVSDAARAHKLTFIDHVTTLAVAAGASPTVGLQIALLAEGAQTTAAITRSSETARAAREAAARLLSPATTGSPSPG